MKKIKLTKQQRSQIIISLSISLAFFLIPLFSLTIGNAKAIDAFIAVAISQLGFFLIWLIARHGLFATTAFGNRRYLYSRIKDKHQSHGGFKIANKSKSQIDFKDSPRQVMDETKTKSKLGIYIGLSIGLIEIIITLIVSYV